MVSKKSRREYASLHTSTKSFPMRKDVEMIWLKNFEELTSCDNGNSELLFSIHRIDGQVMMKNCHQSFTISIDEKSVDAGGEYFFNKPDVIFISTTSGILVFKVMILIPGTEIPPPWIRNHPNSKQPSSISPESQQELNSVNKYIEEAYIRPKREGKPRLMLLKPHLKF